MKWPKSLHKGVERLYQMPLDSDGARSDQRVASAAHLLCLSRTGWDVTDEGLSAMTLDLARVVEEYGISPEKLQAMLVEHEPRLLEDIIDTQYTL
jgi:hypothetical protein